MRSTSPVAQAGGSPVGLEALLVGSSDPVYWSLTGPGQLSSTTGAQVQYQPPARDAQLVAIDVRVTASSRRLVQTLTIRLQPAAGSPPPVPGTRWEVTSYPRYGFSDLQWVDGRFFLLTSTGGVLNSVDGIVWTPRFSSKGDLRALALGHAGFVAVGDGTVFKSSDGDAWVNVSTADSPDLWDVVAGNGVYVATGNGGLARSSDGLAWQRVGPPIARGRSVAFGAGRFIVSANGTHVHTSTDGSAWVGQALAETTAGESCVGYGNGRFLVLNETSHYTSTDAVTWTRRPAGRYVGARLRFANGVFYLTGYRERVIWASTDGENWYEAFRSPIVGALAGMAEHAGRTVVANVMSLSHRSEGGNFTSGLPGPSTSIRGMTTVDGIAYAVTEDGAVLSSRDGRAWDIRVEGLQAGFRAIVHARGLFVAASDGGPRAIYWSANGVDWTGSDVGLFRAHMAAVTFGNGIFVAVGLFGEAMRSPDGVTWELIPTPVRVELSSVSHGAGRFVAGSVQGHLITSTDGRNWSLIPETLWRVQGITHGPQGFVAVTGWGAPGAGLIWHSPDGLSWSRSAAGETMSLGAVTWGGGLYLAAGHQGAVLLSPDGISWQERASGVRSPLLAATVMPGRFVVGGDGGAVVISEQ